MLQWQKILKRLLKSPNKKSLNAMKRIRRKKRIKSNPKDHNLLLLRKFKRNNENEINQW